jgi:hypothetical protein
MDVLLTTEPGLGQTHSFDVLNANALPAWIRARLYGNTAKILGETTTAETAMIEPRSQKAVTAAQNAPPKRRR